EGWLDLRKRATAGLIPSVRDWLADDFRREMLNKPWWHVDHMWLAIAGDLRVADVRRSREASGQPSSPALTTNDTGHLVGAVTLAFREGSDAKIPVVHWLLVDPMWRRRGVARALMSHLELAAWNSGHREVQLETHDNWQAAV